MKVHYNRKIGIMFIVLGSLILISYVIRTNFSALDFFAGISSTIVGVSFLKRTYFIIEENKLIHNSLIGPLKRTYGFNSINDLMVENDKIYIKKDNKKTRIMITKLLVDGSDWNIFLNKIKK